MNVVSGQATLSVEIADRAQHQNQDLLFLHAGVTDKRSWRSITAALSDHYRCISFDARGFGETTYLPEEGWSPVDDAVRVLDAVGSARAVLVGSSSGGHTAVDVAIAHPDRVTALVLIAPAVRGAPYPDPSEREQALEEEAECAQTNGEIDRANALEAQLWLDGPTSAEGRVGGRARELFLEMNGGALRSTDPGPAAARPDAWQRLGEIGVPTLVLAGDLDVSDLRVVGREMVTLLPQGEFIELEGVAHLPQLETPESLAVVTSNFLSRLGSISG